MPKQKAPAFLFYTDNFMGGTMFFTDEQVGKYIRLLCAQHSTGRLSRERFMAILKVEDSFIAEKFTIDENGCYYNERLEMEINKRTKFVETRRNNLAGKGEEPEKPKIKTKEERKAEFRIKVEPYIEKYGKEMIEGFISHWCESSDEAKKLRYEKQAAFEIPKRLATWHKNDRTNFGKNQSTELPQQNGVTILKAPKFIS